MEKYQHKEFPILPIFLAKVPAGFPSPAIDYAKDDINLAKELVKHPEATYLVRAIGTSLIEAGINDGAILVVDTSLTPKSGDIVVASIDGEFTAKRLVRTGGKWYLKPENKDFKPMLISGKDNVQIKGVVTSATNQFI